MSNFNVAATAQNLPGHNRRFSHALKLTALEIAAAAVLAGAVADDTLTFRIALPALPCVVGEVALGVPKPLADASDAAFNVTTASIGDTGSATKWIPATEVNVNGTEITLTSSKHTLASATLGNANSEISGLTIGGTYSQAEVQLLRTAAEELGDDVRNIQAMGAKRYTSTNYINVLLTPASGKSLADLDTGEIVIAADILTLSDFA